MDREVKTLLQEEALTKLSKLKVGALFMRMGTGKTRVAIELVDNNNCELLIYICPFSVKQTVLDEMQKWRIKTPYEIIGYETISMSDRKYLEILKEIEGKKVFIIADESVFIKNDSSKRFERLKYIREKCEYALILNGTPLTKNEWDLYNQMDFLSPKILKMSRSEFTATFFTHVFGKSKGRKIDFYKFSEINAELLYKLIEPYIIYSDVLEKLPMYHEEWIVSNSAEYNSIKNGALGEMARSGEFEKIMALLTKLNKISAVSETKLKCIAKMAKGRKVIIYCAFLDEIALLKKHLDCFVITGETKNREFIIEEFRKGTKPLVMTYGVGAYGLNLQFCNEIIFSSMTFDFAKVKQAEARVNRLGQMKEVTITYVLSNFGINRMIMENLNRKANLSRLIKEYISSEKIENIFDKLEV